MMLKDAANAREVEVAIVHNHWIHYKDLLFSALAAEGMDFVVMFTGATSSQRRQEDAFKSSRYQYVRCFAGSYESAGHLRSALRIWTHLNMVRPKCLIVSGWYDCAAWSAWLWGRTHRVPMILWAESNIFDHKRRRPLEMLKRLFVSAFKVAHVYGTSNKEYLLTLGMDEGRILLKRAVLDVTLFGPCPVVNRTNTVRKLAFVGRFAPEKNLFRLLVAFKRANQREGSRRVKLLMIGYGPLQAELQRTVSELELGDDVDFYGPAEQCELPRLLSGCDGLILPSVSETWGLVVGEAMCCGLPVLVSTRCGCAIDLVSKQTGWKFDPMDESDIVTALCEFANASDAALADMGQSAREVAERYSPENCAKLVSDSVKRVLVATSVD